jgi:hypothetical protein
MKNENKKNDLLALKREKIVVLTARTGVKAGVNKPSLPYKCVSEPQACIQ